MRSLPLVAVTAALLVAVACAKAPATGDEPTVDVPVATPSATPVATTAPTTAAPAPAQTFTGKLAYTPLPATMSVEAYMGVEFTVAAESGDVVLDESPTVSRDALIALDGKNVTVTCVLEPIKPPVDDGGAHPIDGNGDALPRPQKCAVTSIAGL